MKFTLDPQAKAAIIAMLSPVLDDGALAAGEQLEENLSAGPRSGRQYAGLPRQSSAPGEYPQQQSGALKGGVFAEPTADPLTKVIGLEDDMGKLAGLEFAQPHEGGRAPLRMTITDAATHQRMRKAMER